MFRIYAFFLFFLMWNWLYGLTLENGKRENAVAYINLRLMLQFNNIYFILECAQTILLNLERNR